MPSDVTDASLGCCFSKCSPHSRIGEWQASDLYRRRERPIIRSWELGELLLHAWKALVGGVLLGSPPTAATLGRVDRFPMGVPDSAIGSCGSDHRHRVSNRASCDNNGTTRRQPT